MILLSQHCVSELGLVDAGTTTVRRLNTGRIVVLYPVARRPVLRFTFCSLGSASAPGSVGTQGLLPEIAGLFGWLGMGLRRVPGIEQRQSGFGTLLRDIGPMTAGLRPLPKSQCLASNSPISSVALTTEQL